MAHTVFESLDEVRAAVGTTLGTSGWIEVTRDQVDSFALATGTAGTTGAADAAASDRIVPGPLVLALTNLVLPEIVEVRNTSLGVNYGTGRVRFPAPLPVGARVRGRAELVACDDVPGGVQTTIVITMEIEGGGPPACTVESLSRWLA
ncbi:MAG TPA: dehydratase [Acidimicrobiales bacterium]|jgi:acyl dehydratase|nr:dehydratase [Acidimicrobiales bacterium]